MKFVAPILVATSLLLVACSGPAGPLGKPPSGPPPEYEAPRSFDLPGAKPVEPPPAPTEPAPAPEQPAP